MALWFRQIKYAWNQGVSDVLLFCGKWLICFLLEVFPRVLYFETMQPDWPAVWSSSLVTKVASSSTNAEMAGEVWAFVSVHQLPPVGPIYQLQSDKSLFSFHFRLQKRKVIMFPLSCWIAHVCSLSVKQMCLSWPALVSPDSYIVNQSSFSSINDKDLYYYKNLRNLWVCVACSDCLHTQICSNVM